jgi:signal peptidase I
MWWMVLASLLFPGFGQALVHRTLRAIAWAVAAVATLFGIAWSVWLWPVTLLVHVAAAFDAAHVLRRDARPGGLNKMLGAIVLAAGAIGAGAWKLGVQGYRIPTSSMYPTIEIGDHVFVDKLSIHWKPVERGEVVMLRYPCDPSVVYVKRVVALGGDSVEVRCDMVYVNGKRVDSSLVAKDWEYEDYDTTDHAWERTRVSRYHETLNGHAYDVYESPYKVGERDFPTASVAPTCRGPHAVQGQITPRQHVAIQSIDNPLNHVCDPDIQYVVPKGTVFVLGDNRFKAVDSRTWGAVREDDILGRVVGVWFNDHDGLFGRFGDLQ